jgi:hypothetical protein
MNRGQLLLLLATTVAAAWLSACGGSPSTSSATNNDPNNLGWTGQTNVEAAFEANCSGCHGSQWASCWDVQASADVVESAISSGAMPRGGGLSASDKTLMLGWLAAGAQCTGQRPTGGNDGGVTSLPPTTFAGSAIALP